MFRLNAAGDAGWFVSIVAGTEQSFSKGVVCESYSPVTKDISGRSLDLFCSLQVTKSSGWTRTFSRAAIWGGRQRAFQRGGRTSATSCRRISMASTAFYILLQFRTIRWATLTLNSPMTSTIAPLFGWLNWQKPQA